jgi:hypothetical protein
MDREEATPNEGAPPGQSKKPLIKRRWAIMRNAGGGVAVIAVAGALALSDPTDNGDPGDDPGGSGPQVTAEG